MPDEGGSHAKHRHHDRPKGDPTNAPVFASFAVKDIDLARKFYGNTLGLDVREDKQMGILEIHSPDKSHVLVYPKPDHQPANFTVRNLQVRDIDEIVDLMTATGLKFERYDTADMKTDAKGVVRGDKGGLARASPGSATLGQHRVRDGEQQVLTTPQTYGSRRRWSHTGGVSMWAGRSANGGYLPRAVDAKPAAFEAVVGLVVIAAIEVSRLWQPQTRIGRDEAVLLVTAAADPEARLRPNQLTDPGNWGRSGEKELANVREAVSGHDMYFMDVDGLRMPIPKRDPDR